MNMELFDPESLGLEVPEDETQCGHATEFNGDVIKCGEPAEFTVHFHLDGMMLTECIRLNGCRDHAIPLWAEMWMHTPARN